MRDLVQDLNLVVFWRDAKGDPFLRNCRMLLLESDGPPMWGWNGPRAHDTAYSVLLPWFGEKIALALREEFVRDFLETMKWEGGIIRFEEAEDWLLGRGWPEEWPARQQDADWWIPLWGCLIALLMAQGAGALGLGIGVALLPGIVAARAVVVGLLRTSLRAQGYRSATWTDAANIYAKAIEISRWRSGTAAGTARLLKDLPPFDDFASSPQFDEKRIAESLARAMRLRAAQLWPSRGPRPEGPMPTLVPAATSRSRA
jgi:hypothetical protein